MPDMIDRFLIGSAASILGAAIAFTASSSTFAANAETSPDAVDALDFRSVVREAKGQVFPAVVYIKVVREGLEAGEKKNQQVSGSGVIIDPEGHVVTNWHVVEKAVRVRCQLTDGSAVKAEVVGTDKTTDLAVLKLLPEKPTSFPYAEIGDSTVLTEGDFVMAMGAPWGMNRSVSIGIISCTDRYLDENSEYAHWLQTDASISPGNSGGPLVNTEGRVIGINTRGSTGGGDLGFAIPSEVFRELVPHIIESGVVPWSWLGLQLQPLRDFDRDTYFNASEGVIVAGTDPSSPARLAGLLTDDRIIKLNGEPITALTSEQLPTVRRRFGLLPLGEPATLTLVRGAEEKTIELTPREKGTVEGEEYECTRWDLAAKEINQFDNPDLYFQREQGVFIFSVKYPGNAAMSGLRDNDIILAINNEKVTTLDDIERIHKKLIENVDDEHRAVFRVLRGGLMNMVVLDYLRDYSKE